VGSDLMILLIGLIPLIGLLAIAGLLIWAARREGRAEKH
jgi:hypothetical protein